MANKTDADLDRGSFDLNGTKSKKKRNPLLFIFGVVLILASIGIGGWLLLKDDSSTVVTEPQRDVALDRTKLTDSSVEDLKAGHIQQEREKAEQERKQKQREVDEARKKAAAEEEKRKAAAELERKKKEAQMMTGQADKDQGGNGKQLTPEQRKMAGDIVVQIPKRKGDNNSSGSNDSNNSGSLNDGPSDSLRGTTYADGRVTLKNAAARKYLLTHGTTLRCALYTEIVTDYAGPVLCRLTKDLYSSDGSIKLAEAGSLLTGERSVALEPGKARIFTQWRELETANGVRAQLNSLGTGPLGATGSEAWIDNHYSQRFGGAIILSLFDDAMASLANMASNKKSDVTYDNSTSNASDMASIALEQSINIAPTGHIVAGTIINVLVVRDVDFSSIYTVR